MVSSTIQGGGGSVRGVRDQFQSGTILGVLPGKGKGVPIKRLTLTQIATAIANNGGLPLPGNGLPGYITSVDSLFTVTGGALSLHTAAAHTLMGNPTGSTAEPVNSITLGTNLSFAGSVLNATGGALNNRGAWDGLAGYNPFDVVQWLSSSYLNFAATTAPAAAAQWDSGNLNEMSLTTTVSANDTATSTAGANQWVLSAANSHSSGKWYFEFKATSFADNGTAVGVSTAAGPLVGNNFIGNYLGQIHGSAAGSGSGSFFGIINGNRGGIAIDMTGGLFWITNDVTAGSINWNGSTSNSPGAGTGGIAIGTMGGAMFQLFYSQSTTGQKCELFATPAVFSIAAIPAGFTAWGGTATPNTAPDLDITHWVAQGNQNPANLNEHALLGGV